MVLFSGEQPQHSFCVLFSARFAQYFVTGHHNSVRAQYPASGQPGAYLGRFSGGQFGGQARRIRSVSVFVVSARNTVKRNHRLAQQFDPPRRCGRQDERCFGGNFVVHNQIKLAVIFIRFH